MWILSPIRPLSTTRLPRHRCARRKRVYLAPPPGASVLWVSLPEEASTSTSREKRDFHPMAYGCAGKVAPAESASGVWTRARFTRYA
jgi:hypothetical protein